MTDENRGCKYADICDIYTLACDDNRETKYCKVYLKYKQADIDNVLEESQRDFRLHEMRVTIEDRLEAASIIGIGACDSHNMRRVLAQ